MKTLLLTLLLATNVFAQGGERVGNGGSYSEAEIAAEQVELELTVNKIKKFFINNKQVADIFPEFSMKEFFAKTNHVSITVVDKELFDKHNVKRTCLNYDRKIECDINELQQTHNDPKIYFVLMLHELLGIVGVEETSPENATAIEGYKISKRIARYVSRVSNYDLDVDAAPETFSFSTPTNRTQVRHNAYLSKLEVEDTRISCKSDMDSVCMFLGKTRAVSHKCSTKRFRSIISQAWHKVDYFVQNYFTCGGMASEQMQCQGMQILIKDAFLTKIVTTDKAPNYFKKQLVKVREGRRVKKYEYLSKIVCE